MANPNLDYQLGFLCLFILGCLFALLAPTPGERRKGPRTHDTRHIRRSR